LVVITAPFAAGTAKPTAFNSSVLEMTLHNLAISGFVERRVAMACSAAVTSEEEYKARMPRWGVHSQEMFEEVMREHKAR
jgi:hypothetical protein